MGVYLISDHLPQPRLTWPASWIEWSLHTGTWKISARCRLDPFPRRFNRLYIESTSWLSCDPVEYERPNVLVSAPEAPAASPKESDEERREGQQALAGPHPGIARSIAWTSAEAWIERLTVPKLLIAMAIVSL